jgi:hypothetical protein
MSQATKSAALTVSIKDLSPLMSALLDEGKEIRFTVTGNSMGPFLRHKRDQAVLVKPADPTALQVGDVPLYQRDNGQLVLHRIAERDDGRKRYLWGEREPFPSMHVDGPLTYTMLGDAQTVSEPNIRPEQIMAVATAFIRKGKRVECRVGAYRRRTLFWHTLMPVRAPLVHLWHVWYGVKNKFTRIFSKK